MEEQPQTPFIVPPQKPKRKIWMIALALLVVAFGVYILISYLQRKNTDIAPQETTQSNFLDSSLSSEENIDLSKSFAYLNRELTFNDPKTQDGYVDVRNSYSPDDVANLGDGMGHGPDPLFHVSDSMLLQGLNPKITNQVFFDHGYFQYVTGYAKSLWFDQKGEFIVEIINKNSGKVGSVKAHTYNDLASTSFMPFEFYIPQNELPLGKYTIILTSANNPPLTVEIPLTLVKADNGWIQSAEFGLYYSWNMNPPAEFYRVGTEISEEAVPNGIPVFSLVFDDGAAVITWGDVWQGGTMPGTCTENEFGEFQYGVSGTACVKGRRAWVSRFSARETVTQDDLKKFGDFVLKNK